MKGIIKLIIILLLTQTTVAQKTSTIIEFWKNGKQQQLKNNFEIYFVYEDSVQRVIYKPTIKENKFIIPEIYSDTTKYHMLFCFEEKVFYISSFNHVLKDIVKLEIKFDNTSNDYYWLEPNIRKNIKGYIQLTICHDRGDPPSRDYYISNFKEYYKKGKALLKW